MKINCSIIFFSFFLMVFSLHPMDHESIEQPSIVIVDKIIRANGVGSPLLGRATLLRYSRDVLESFAMPQTDMEKLENEKFVKSISNKIAAVEAAMQEAKSAHGAKEAKSRKNLTRSTP